MPNWCYNSMTITGPIEEVEHFKQTCIRVGDGGRPPHFDFNAIVAMPEVLADLAEKPFVIKEDTEPPEPPDWHKWLTAKWGTISNACRFRVRRDEPGRYECGFDTAWSPPIPLFKKIIEMFPALTIELRAQCEMGNYFYKGTISANGTDVHDDKEAMAAWHAAMEAACREDRLHEIERLKTEGVIDDAEAKRLTENSDAELPQHLPQHFDCEDRRCVGRPSVLKAFAPGT